MPIVRLILAELRHRKLAAFIAFVAITAAVALSVALVMAQEASERETKRAMRDIGFNVRIVPKETDDVTFHDVGYSESTMPIAAVKRLAEAPGIGYNHLVATLTRRVEVKGVPVVLSGISGEIVPPGKAKKPMIFKVEPGVVHVGHAVAQKLGVKRGDALVIGASTFKVKRVMPETGQRDDVTVYAALADVQKALDLDGRINEIRAIDCLCLLPDQNPLAVLREQLERLMPEAKVFHMTAMAEARARQRRMTEEFGALALPLILCVCGLWVGVLGFLNVRTRRTEIGLFRALGYGGAGIASVFLGRALVLGVLGAGVGYGLGTALALRVMPSIFRLTQKALVAEPALFWMSLALAPPLAVLATVVPAMIAVLQDPARTLTAD